MEKAMAIKRVGSHFDRVAINLMAFKCEKKQADLMAKVNLMA